MAGIPFRIPDHDELPGRIAAVLDALYAAFATGWNDACGADVAHRDLAHQALFLGRLVKELLPNDPEALGLLALMLSVEARAHARRSAAGDYVPLDKQEVAQWNAEMIAEAEALLHRASTLGSIGRYRIEGALQSAQVARGRTGRANWPAVVHLYEALLALTASPLVPSCSPGRELRKPPTERTR